MNNTEIIEQLNYQKHKIKKFDFFKKYIIKNVVLYLTILFIGDFLFGMVKVVGDSMYPNIQSADIVLYNKFTSNYNCGDIIIIKNSKTNEYYIKRIIGLEGDYINIDSIKRRVIRNNLIISEKYLVNYSTDEHDLKLPLIIPKDKIFVLGDNRLISKDSRNCEFGLIDRNDVKGKMISLIRYAK